MDKISELLTYRKLICHPEVSGFVFTTNTFVLFYAAELRGIKPIEIKNTRKNVKETVPKFRGYFSLRIIFLFSLLGQEF